ncbi:MAG: LuxR family transcriptional regulator [Phycisphaerales bacterium]|nr:MAG: LuxR family transcriptional regulator [Phycisphaerales bacterium]
MEHDLGGMERSVGGSAAASGRPLARAARASEGAGSGAPASAQHPLGLSGIDPRPALDALIADTGCFVILLDAELRVVDANAAALSRVGMAHAQAAGQHASVMMDDGLIEERLGFCRRVLDTGEPVRIEGMFKGAWSRTTFRRVKDQQTGASGLLVVAASADHALPAPDADSVAHVRASRDDLGRLSRLTERELEVLRLIGLGYTTAEIAKQLFRSAKTIEGHRLSLGYKLGASGRVELARIAIESGLVHLSPEDVLRIARQGQAGKTRRVGVQRDHADEN